MTQPDPATAAAPAADPDRPAARAGGGGPRVPAAALLLVAVVLPASGSARVRLPPGARRRHPARPASACTSARRSSGIAGAQSCSQLRLPRVLLAALVGAGLAIAGAAYQGVFRNPLADPYLLGAAAGAGLGATLVIAYAPHRRRARSASCPPAAFVGALGRRRPARYLLGTVAGRAGGGTARTLLLAGIAVAPSSPPSRPSSSSSTPTTCASVYCWLLGQLGAASW